MIIVTNNKLILKFNNFLMILEIMTKGMWYQVIFILTFGKPFKKPYNKASLFWSFFPCLTNKTDTHSWCTIRIKGVAFAVSFVQQNDDIPPMLVVENICLGKK